MNPHGIPTHWKPQHNFPVLGTAGFPAVVFFEKEKGPFYYVPEQTQLWENLIDVNWGKGPFHVLKPIVLLSTQVSISFNYYSSLILTG